MREREERQQQSMHCDWANLGRARAQQDAPLLHLNQSLQHLSPPPPIDELNLHNAVGVYMQKVTALIALYLPTCSADSLACKALFAVLLSTNKILVYNQA